MTIFEFVTAFGIGAIVTTILQYIFAELQYRRSRAFEEKKEAYLGFLNALYESETKRDSESAFLVGHWKNRIELVGAPSVVAACEAKERTNPENGNVHPERPRAMVQLKSSMRVDMRI
jgi:hypothetical protein